MLKAENQKAGRSMVVIGDGYLLGAVFRAVVTGRSISTEAWARTMAGILLFAQGRRRRTEADQGCSKLTWFDAFCPSNARDCLFSPSDATLLDSSCPVSASACSSEA